MLKDRGDEPEPAGEEPVATGPMPGEAGGDEPGSVGGAMPGERATGMPGEQQRMPGE
jgi:hypothetical protein